MEITSRPTRPPSPSWIAGLDDQVAASERRVGQHLDLDRADEVVPLGAGVLADLLGQLALEDLGEGLEALGVARAT